MDIVTMLMFHRYNIYRVNASFDVMMQLYSVEDIFTQISMLTS